MLPKRHALWFSRIVSISSTICVGVLSVVSSSQIFVLSCSCRASTRLTSRISLARFSQSFWSLKPHFSMNSFSWVGLRRRMNTCVVFCLGVTAVA